MESTEKKPSVIYKIIRFMPDQAKGEFINVGVVSLCPQEKKLDYCLSINFKRAIDFFGKDIEKSFFSKIGSMEQFLKIIESRVKKSKNEAACLEIFKKITMENDNSIIYSNLRSSANTTAKELSEKYT